MGEFRLTRAAFGTRNSFGRRGAEIARPAAVVDVAPSEQVAVTSAAATERMTRPVMTIGLAGLLFLVYCLELRFSIDPMPGLGVSLRNIVAFGGAGPYFVFHEKEWWRVFTAPWLHGSLTHLIGNTVALFFAGTALERMLGRGWLAALFVVGALGGSLGSLAYSTSIASVGASGALMCLVTVLFALSHHFAAGDKAMKLRRRALFVVVSAFLPSAAPGAMQIDYGAHFGGFAVGIACGFLLLILWPEDSPTPPLRGAAAGVAVAGLCVTIFAAFQVWQHVPIYAARSAELIPSALEVSDPVAVAKKSDEMVARYPHDPLARLLRGTSLFDERDYGAAAEQAREGLADELALDTEYAPVARERLDVLLAAALWNEGRHDEAKPMVARICASTSTDAYIANGRKLFAQAGLCG
jgi:rhomboid protease GluP